MFFQKKARPKASDISPLKRWLEEGPQLYPRIELLLLTNPIVTTTIMSLCHQNLLQLLTPRSGTDSGPLSLLSRSRAETRSTKQGSKSECCVRAQASPIGVSRQNAFSKPQCNTMCLRKNTRWQRSEVSNYSTWRAFLACIWMYPTTALKKNPTRQGKFSMGVQLLAG